MASAVPNRERNGALAPGDGKTCTPCSSGQHPEFSAYVLRHHQDQPRPRPVAVGTEGHVDDRRASLPEVWQRGFSETRVECRQSFIKHREYIAANPVKAGLVERPEEFPYC